MCKMRIAWILHAIQSHLDRKKAVVHRSKCMRIPNPQGSFANGCAPLSGLWNACVGPEFHSCFAIRKMPYCG